MHTREQIIAADVYQRVTERLAQYDAVPGADEAQAKARKSYGSMAHKLPVLIRVAGLAQALAFLDTRDKEPHKELLKDLASTLGYEAAADLLTRSREAELDEYMLLTRHALDALLWYKRFAESVLDVQGTDEGEES